VLDAFFDPIMSLVATPKALLIPELVERIVDFTFHRPSSFAPAKDCKTLLALARVNKLLSEVALAHLWLSLDNTDQLVSLLSPKLQLLLSKAPQAKLNNVCILRIAILPIYLSALLSFRTSLLRPKISFDMSTIHSSCKRWISSESHMMRSK